MLYEFELSHKTADATKNICYVKVLIGLVEFCGISTIIGYLMPNPLYAYIIMICKCIVCW